VRELGGEVELVGTLSSQREERAAQLVAQAGMVNIHPYADAYVAAGQGTIGLEIVEDLPQAEMVVVPIGGGGLISGVATAVKALAPRMRVVGVEPAGAARYSHSRAAGQPMKLHAVDTIADGTRTDRADPNNFDIIEHRVDALCPTRDDSIRRAMALLMSKAKLMVEPSAAMPVAAALEGGLPVKTEDNVVFVLSGGNVDPALAAQILLEQNG
jgi:threonine dehydratase